jgi:multiple sugar transport system permease protein
MKAHGRREINKILLLLPLAILILLIFAYPFVRSLIFSFYDIPFGSSTAKYIGLRNFDSIVRNQAFWQSLGKSFYWTFGNLFFQLTIPMGIAVLLNKKIRGINLARSLIMLPWVVPAVTIAVCMRWMLLPKIGIISNILVFLGLLRKQIYFLGNRGTAMPVLILLNSWKFLPFGTLMILAALQTISESTYEAAEVDGATEFQKFRFISLPLVSSMIWFVGFLAFTWNFNTFDLIWLTTQGGPGVTTQTLQVLIYRTAFKTFRLGEASAISVAIAALLIGIGILYFTYLTPREKTN